jgi:hypothetical protein
MAFVGEHDISSGPKCLASSHVQCYRN